MSGGITMGWVDNFFNRKKAADKSVPPVVAGSTDPKDEPISVFDEYGRKLHMTKADWRTKVLPGSLEQHWNKPDLLYMDITIALQDGFRADVLKASEHLFKTDTDALRSGCLWAFVLKQEGRLDEAEAVLKDCQLRLGDSAAIQSGLAQVYEDRKNPDEAKRACWRALTMDPNQKTAFGLYLGLANRKGGDAALLALHEIAALPGSWQAQLFLAQEALKSKNLAAALAHYRQALDHAEPPVPADLLMGISGDLGKQGHLREILTLVEPRYDLVAHGLMVGNNLIKAHLDLGEFKAAKSLVEQLYSQQRLEWKENLASWEKIIVKAETMSSQPAEGVRFEVSVQGYLGPIWYGPNSSISELFPTKAEDSPSICFMVGTVTHPAQHPEQQKVHIQLPDAPGRASRIIPLYLVEQIHLWGNASVLTLVPFVKDGGFVLAGTPWPDIELARFARQASPKVSHVIGSHWIVGAETWTLELRLILSLDGTCVATHSATMRPNEVEAALPGLVRETKKLLTAWVSIQGPGWEGPYAAPVPPQLESYLVRLEQLLALRKAAENPSFVHRLTLKREILDGNIGLCLANPHNLAARILFAQTCLAMKQVSPDLLPEFKDRVLKFQAKHPLDERGQGIVQSIFNEALG